MADDGGQIVMSAPFALRTQKPLSTLWTVTRSTRPASTSGFDGPRSDYMRISGSFISSKMRALHVVRHRES
jgi:hypothetical protein